MIVSHEHRFIFVKTRKTAGTSIETYLSSRCGAQDIVSPVKPPEPGHVPRNYRGLFNPWPEIRASGGRRTFRTLSQLVRRRRFLGLLPAYVLRSRLPRETWDGYFKFCVERNPWDKVVSGFHFQAQERGMRLSFEEFLASRRLFGLSDFRMYTDPTDGRPIVDRILRFEALDRELGEVLERLGLPWNGALGVRAKSGFRRDRRPYAELYDEPGRRRVAEVFVREIALLGYTFEGRD
jgi:hypothetical protein